MDPFDSGDSLQAGPYSLRYSHMGSSFFISLHRFNILRANPILMGSFPGEHLRPKARSLEKICPVLPSRLAFAAYRLTPRRVGGQIDYLPSSRVAKEKDHNILWLKVICREISMKTLMFYLHKN